VSHQSSTCRWARSLHCLPEDMFLYKTMLGTRSDQKWGTLSISRVILHQDKPKTGSTWSLRGSHQDGALPALWCPHWLFDLPISNPCSVAAWHMNAFYSNAGIVFCMMEFHLGLGLGLGLGLRIYLFIYFIFYLFIFLFYFILFFYLFIFFFFP
jgi:hypothetical protein